MPEIYFTYLNGIEVEALQMSEEEIIGSVENALRAQGNGETKIEPRTHILPEDSAKGHFNVLRGYIRPLDIVGVKVVGDFVENYKVNLPSELAVLNLFDPHTGAIRAILDASSLTDMRTGAMTAIGAKYLARKNSRILGHIGSRGTAYWNVRLLDHIFDFEEIRVHSRRPESQEKFGKKLEKDLGKPIKVVTSWEECLKDADILVEASRLTRPEPLFKTSWIKKGAFVVPYGTMSAVEIDLTDIMDKVVVDDWGQCKKGLPFGSLRRHVDEGRLNEETLYAEMGQIVAGIKPGRENDEENILFWHRGLSTSDIALGCAMLKKAEEKQVGTRLRFC